MFRTLARKFLPNPLDAMLKQTARKGGKRILLGWNRGLGDIALGLYAMVERVRAYIPDAEITFVTRENLRDGFSMLEGVKAIVASDWKRGEFFAISQKLKKEYDLVIEKPNPTDWVYWQRGKVTPKLKWNAENDSLYEKFRLPADCIGVQLAAETNYGLWRNWPLEKWNELFDRLKNQTVLLFGFGTEPKFSQKNVIDLRGKTNLFELLSIIKHRCSALVLPDSGISSMVYYLNESFPIRLVSLWADPNHGILKQNVASPNPQLVHCPVIAQNKDLSSVSVDTVLERIFPLANAGVILLAAGQGSRLGFKGPKGLFTIGGKTLFQWFCEKLPKNFPLAIMTSPLNHQETVDYFERNHFFGLEIFFFQQEMVSFLDEKKNPMLEKGPNGNGNVFRAFCQSGLDEVFAKKRIDVVTVNYIDNPLVKPLDPPLIALARSADVAVQCISREPNDRLMGVIDEEGNKLRIIEYTELDSSKEYRYAYSGQMAFNFSFFRKMGELDLPLHWVQKKMGDKIVWKGEQFIFDILPFADRAKLFEVSRNTHFAPLKRHESIEAVEQQLLTSEAVLKSQRENL